MNNEFQFPNQSMTCAEYELQLADYVRAELNGDAAEETWPSLAHHIETCAECERAYFVAFRQQGRERSQPELEALGERSRSASALAQILKTDSAESALSATSQANLDAASANPSWHEKVIQQGKIWLEEGSAQVRQLTVELGSALMPIQPGVANAGLMGSEELDAADGAYPQLSGSVQLPPDSGLEVKVITAGQSTNDGDSGDKNLCQLQVAVTLTEQLGDYSGVDVLLRWGDHAYSAQTDAMGLAHFDALPINEIPSMSLTISV